MIYDTAKTLARELQESQEYRVYRDAKDAAMENESTRALLKEYHRLQLQAQGLAVSGKQDGEIMQKLQKIGEVLQFDSSASAFLMAEFRINRMLADVYKILAEAVDVDLSSLEA